VNGLEAILSFWVVAGRDELVYFRGRPETNPNVRLSRDQFHQAGPLAVLSDFHVVVVLRATAALLM
jgi:hypothetical protein